MDGPTVRLAGSFGVLRNGAPESPEGLGSRKARTLLVLLAARRGRIVPVEQIIEVLWSGDLPSRPARAVATIVSRLRAALGPDVVLHVPQGYRLGEPPAVRVDLDDVALLLERCRGWLVGGDQRLAAATGRRACALLGEGPALAGEADTDWVQDVRAEHTALLRTARQATAEALLGAGDAVGAAGFATAAARADRFDEAALRLLMAAYQAAGEPARALTIYERLRHDLADELGVDPAPETRAVHQAVLAEDRPAADTARITPGAPALAGRTAEVARLTAAWAGATAGGGGVLLVVGEGGIGKTRLAGEVVAAVEATGGRLLTARCYGSERSLFLQPIVDAVGSTLAALPAGRLRELAGPRAAALVGLFPDLVDVLGPAGAERGSAENEVRRTFEVVAAVLRGLAADRPTLLLLDDLHNAGLATVELLHYLGRHLGRSRLLVLATLRAEEGAAALDALGAVAQRLDLGPLPAEAVLRLAAEAGQAAEAEAILRRTRGHPLFVVETLRGLAAGETGAPETLQAVVLARVRRVGRDVEEVLRAGAVLGAAVDSAVVAAMLGIAPYDVVQRCAQAAAARLLVVADRDYEFANDLIQEVLYASTPAPVRVAHHRRAADLSTRQPEVVARHASAAADWPRAARAFLLAGEQALGRFAAADAEVLLSRALHAAERVGDAELVSRGLLARGRAREIRGVFRPAVGDYRAALATAREAGDRRHEMLALRQLGGHTSAVLGVSALECIGRLRDGLAIAGSLGDRAVEAGFLARLAVLATSRLQFDDAVRLGRRAVAAGRAARSDRALAQGLDGLKNAYAYLGESQPLTEVIDELQALLSRLGDLDLAQWAMFESAVPAIGAAEWDEAERRILEAVRICRRGGLVGHDSWFVAHLGWLARLQGRLDTAAEHGRAAVDLVPDAGRAWFGPAAEALLAGTLMELGQTAAAVELLEDGLRYAAADGAEGYRLRCLAPLAEATGDPDVLAEADALLAGITAPPGSAWLLGNDVYLAVARAWLHHGEPARARGVLVPLLAAAQRLGWEPVLATAGLVDVRAAAASGDPSTAAASAALAARAAWHGMPLVAEAALLLAVETT